MNAAVQVLIDRLVSGGMTRHVPALIAASSMFWYAQNVDSCKAEKFKKLKCTFPIVKRKSDALQVYGELREYQGYLGHQHKLQERVIKICAHETDVSSQEMIELQEALEAMEELDNDHFFCDAFKTFYTTCSHYITNYLDVLRSEEMLEEFVEKMKKVSYPILAVGAFALLVASRGRSVPARQFFVNLAVGNGKDLSWAGSMSVACIETGAVILTGSHFLDRVQEKPLPKPMEFEIVEGNFRFNMTQIAKSISMFKAKQFCPNFRNLLKNRLPGKLSEEESKLFMKMAAELGKVKLDTLQYYTQESIDDVQKYITSLDGGNFNAFLEDQEDTVALGEDAVNDESSAGFDPESDEPEFWQFFFSKIHSHVE